MDYNIGADKDQNNNIYLQYHNLRLLPAGLRLILFL